MVKMFTDEPVQRLIDTVFPDVNVALMNNPVLKKLPQIMEFGWHDCTPQHRNKKLRQTFADVNPMEVVEHIGHAKRWIREKITTYIDGALIYFIRHAKFVLDAIRIIQYAARIVATLRYIETLIREELARALAFANECVAMVNYGLATLSPAGLRGQAEEETAAILNQAVADIDQQIGENGGVLQCLI